MSWEDVYINLAEEGLEQCDIINSNAVWDRFLRDIGFRKRVLPNTCPTCYTVKMFCREHPEGEYVLATGSHAIAAIDGDYYDWKNYPVHTIEYDTPGTNNNYVDAKGSIYTNDGIAYVHCFTNYWDGSDTGYKRGAEFLEVTVLFNGVHTKLIAVDLGDNGSLSWPSSDTRELPVGTHHYALFYFSDSRLSTNMNNINSLDHYLGEMYITVSKDDLHDETEFWFDVAALQKCGNIDSSFNGKIEVLFHRVGWKLLPTSGVSTGPIFVAVLSTVAAGSYLTYSKRKKRA